MWPSFYNISPSVLKKNYYSTNNNESKERVINRERETESDREKKRAYTKYAALSKLNFSLVVDNIFFRES